MLLQEHESEGTTVHVVRDEAGEMSFVYAEAGEMSFVDAEAGELSIEWRLQNK